MQFRLVISHTGGNADSKDFSAAVRLLMSDNGRHDLNGLQFQVYYLRAQKPAAEYQAAIVAIEGRTARHTFISEYTGTTHEMAFAKLKIDIEQRVGKLLKSEAIKTPRPWSSTLQRESTGGATQNGNVQPPPYVLNQRGST